MTFKSMNGEISLQPDAVYSDCIKDQFLTIFIPTLSVSLMTTKKWFIQTKTNDFN